MSIQQCSIDIDKVSGTSTVMITTYGDKVIYAMQGSHIRYRCLDQNGKKIWRRQKWFFQSGGVINISRYPNYAPYSINKPCNVK